MRDEALTDRERAWLQARAAALAPGAEIHAGPLPPGADGRIVLSSDPAASAIPAHHGHDGATIFLAEVAHVAPGRRW